MEVKYKDSLMFPAVTVCNNNWLRKGVLNDSGVLDFGLSLSSFDYPVVNSSSYNLTEFFMTYGHQMDRVFDLPWNCDWKLTDCTSANFTKRITDMGMCFTFNHGGDLRSTFPGEDYGLRLGLFAEQDQYLPATSKAGFTVLLHQPTDVPRMANGFQVTTGESLIVAISMTEVHNLPEPYGGCTSKKLAYYPIYSATNCRSECL
ncbi:acid-sensing ion channel 2-like [Lingula anatina]|uniref:Acid-sensing ion channel 2-like n=1 Tax=Lingula anatina TaxID=7574 RepID=A0A2R2MLX7_LINAN|nr:acid-sensing ion channel 2-like [Lingula anatina]|eukprot:XP_023931210.1 acid-sensing ion channel 2-like [Lingula anatina]